MESYAGTSFGNTTPSPYSPISLCLTPSSSLPVSVRAVAISVCAVTVFDHCCLLAMSSYLPLATVAFTLSLSLLRPPLSLCPYCSHRRYHLFLLRRLGWWDGRGSRWRQRRLELDDWGS
ncbi:hypothetical protein RIF29_14306 [Crotalaria pallida]|uniref:Uncharacterized protein n=1 Tax=Crotalaria pallida TaxID=3830 RepID=A0AAN9FB83_CROPI